MPKKSNMADGLRVFGISSVCTSRSFSQMLQPIVVYKLFLFYFRLNGDNLFEKVVNRSSKNVMDIEVFCLFERNHELPEITGAVK